MQKFPPPKDKDCNCSTGTSLNKKMKLSDSKEEEEEVADSSDTHIVHRNQSVQMSVFKDPETLHGMLIIVVLLPSGVEKAQFSLVGDGPGTRTAKIEYDWPSISLDPEEYFDFEMSIGALNKIHPKVVSLKDDLRFFRTNIDHAPKGSMELTLPISVQIISSSFYHTAVNKKSDGSRLLIVELMAYQTAYNVGTAEKQITFKSLP